MGRYDDRKTRLRVGELSSRTCSTDLERIFRRYGRVRNVDMKQGYAYVEFSGPCDAADARYNLDRTEVDGRFITVEFARVQYGEIGQRERNSRNSLSPRREHGYSTSRAGSLSPSHGLRGSRRFRRCPSSDGPAPCSLSPTFWRRNSPTLRRIYSPPRSCSPVLRRRSSIRQCTSSVNELPQNLVENLSLGQGSESFHS